MQMQSLNPTLWRTCRVLAGTTRWKLLRSLFENPDRDVSSLARLAGIGESAASQDLRRLQSRGLLRRHQMGVHVLFRPLPDPQVATAAPLLKAIQVSVARHPPEQDADACRLAQGLAHERRIEIARVLLRQGPLPQTALANETNIPPDSLSRHLRCMKTCGWVQTQSRRVALVPPAHPLAKALAKLL